MPDEVPTRCDVLIAGGGLAGGLIALALAEKRPSLDVRIVDPSRLLGGNHVWSFFDPDVAAEDRWLVEPLICHRWGSYDIAFPAHRRTLDTAYNSIESERLDEVVRAALPADRIIADGVAKISGNGVTLTSTREGLAIFRRAGRDGRNSSGLK
jgi:lycopene beta-cyclase